MIRNFLITSHQRSGTQWLGWVLDHGDRWTVRHEPGGSGDARVRLASVQPRFSRDRYGEVNSVMRFHATGLQVAKKGVIIRRIDDLWLSVANRYDIRREFAARLAELTETVGILDELRLAGAAVIVFEKMVADPRYVERLAAWLGIEGLHVEANWMQPRNVTAHKKYTTIDSALHVRDRLDTLEARIDTWREDDEQWQ